MDGVNNPNLPTLSEMVRLLLEKNAALEDRIRVLENELEDKIMECTHCPRNDH